MKKDEVYIGQRVCFSREDHTGGAHPAFGLCGTVLGTNDTNGKIACVQFDPPFHEGNYERKFGAESRTWFWISTPDLDEEDSIVEDKEIDIQDLI